MRGNGGGNSFFEKGKNRFVYIIGKECRARNLRNELTLIYAYAVNAASQDNFLLFIRIALLENAADGFGMENREHALGRVARYITHGIGQFVERFA